MTHRGCRVTVQKHLQSVTEVNSFYPHSTGSRLSIAECYKNRNSAATVRPQKKKINMDFHTDIPFSSSRMSLAGSDHRNMVRSNLCNPLTVVLLSTIIRHSFVKVIKRLLYFFSKNMFQMWCKETEGRFNLQWKIFCNIFLYSSIQFHRLCYSMFCLDKSFPASLQRQVLISKAHRREHFSKSNSSG